MKRSISNIAWSAEQDERVYRLMEAYGCSGLEIAPTRLFPECPYDHIREARAWADGIRERYGLVVSSMQSICYGRQERLFGSPAERQVLLEYTKKAIDFAEAVGCANLVFGCPRNRQLPEGNSGEAAIPFFRDLGDYAAAHHTVLAMEANPPLYHTNYINSTRAAIALIRAVDSPGFRLNLDVGTMIENGEEPVFSEEDVRLIHHVHISEPGLTMIRERGIHRQLMELLRRDAYAGFVSIEMGDSEMADIEWALGYLREICPSD